MADVQKFLDRGGVSILWSKVAEKVESVNSKVDAQGQRLATAESKIEALEKGTYDDTAIRGLISANKTAIESNDADILALQGAVDTLNGNAETAGSVAHTATSIAAAKVAEIVAGADVKYDTLKEIADWILNDTTGAADMANDIKALEDKMVGIESTVVAKIADEISAALKVEGADKYALASDLSSLADRVKALEDAGYQNAEQVGSAIDTKIAALDLANTYDAKGAAATAESNAKAHADTLNSSMDVRVKAIEAIEHNFDAKGSAATAEANAKTYTDTEIAKIQALTEAEIIAAINEASQQA